MNTITIGDEKYVIMKRSEFADVSQEFIEDGAMRERVSKSRINAIILGALNFYAVESNYLPNISKVAGVDPDMGLTQNDLANVLADNGKKARDAIDAYVEE